MNRSPKTSLALLLALLTTLLPVNTAVAEGPLAGFPGSRRSERLDRIVASAVTNVLGGNWTPPLASDQLAVTVVDITDPAHPAFGSHRGEAVVYPASVIKLFYLGAVHRWMEDGRIADTPEVRRAMRDMIVESYNEPTHYLVDLLTGTTSGPELPEAELKTWWDRRNAVNRWLASLGYPASINASKKPWCEGPYGRESQAAKAFEPRRNFLTTEATARFLSEIALGRMVTPERSRQMLELLARDFRAPTNDPEDQAHGYTGQALVAGMELWSKCGLTSETRHDAALVKLPDGRRLVLVVFTTDHATERKIIPSVVSGILEGY